MATEDLFEGVAPGEETETALAMPTTKPKTKLILKNKRKANKLDDISGSEAPVAEPPVKKSRTKGTVNILMPKSQNPPHATGPLQEEAVKPKPTPTKKSQRASARPKKPSPRKIAAETNGAKKKEVEEMLPPPRPRPARISEPVFNKVKQVHWFMNTYELSKLDRDQENRDLISVPESSLLSAVMRMRVHYELDQPLEEAMSDVDAAVVRRFKQPIGPQTDIDWVTIDATKHTDFEDRIQEKIARHGLEDVNLLEIELEMFRRDHLMREGLLDDNKAIGWDADRFVRTFDQIWKKITAKGYRRTDSGIGEDSNTRGEIRWIGVCPAPMQPAQETLRS